MAVACTSANASSDGKRELSPAILQQAIERIVEAADPEKIILFGSAARGTMGVDSDVDLLVIKEGSTARRPLMAKIYRHLRGVPEAFDIVVATPDEIDEFGSAAGYVFASALREGRIVYAA